MPQYIALKKGQLKNRNWMRYLWTFISLMKNRPYTTWVAILKCHSHLWLLNSNWSPLSIKTYKMWALSYFVLWIQFKVERKKHIRLLRLDSSFIGQMAFIYDYSGLPLIWEHDQDEWACFSTQSKYCKKLFLCKRHVCLVPTSENISPPDRQSPQFLIQKRLYSPTLTYNNTRY